MSSGLAVYCVVVALFTLGDVLAYFAADIPRGRHIWWRYLPGSGFIALFKYNRSRR
jgi:hypothetical protein